MRNLVHWHDLALTYIQLRPEEIHNSYFSAHASFIVDSFANCFIMSDLLSASDERERLGMFGSSPAVAIGS